MFNTSLIYLHLDIPLAYTSGASEFIPGF